MKIQEEIKNKVTEAVKSLYDLEPEISVDIPKDNSFGDYSVSVAMRLAKELSKNPVEVAEEIKNKLSIEKVDEITVVKPGFINFKVSDSYFKNIVNEIVKMNDQYGKNDLWKDKTILIEHTSPNPNKEFHLGHWKNSVTGLSVSYLFEQMGAKVFRDCIDNNRGIAIAKLMWGYLKFAKKDESLPNDLDYWYENKDKWFTPEEKGIEPGRFVDGLYTKGSEDADNPEVDKIVRQLVLDWEAEKKENWALWELTQKWVWDGYKQSLNRVNGWKFDKIWHEHEIYKLGKEHVQRGLEEGIFKKLPDGAIISDLKKEFNLTDTVLIKNDGTSLYITQDLELTKRKRETFNPDEMFWVIGPEQSLAMKQMFAVSSQLGFGKYEDFHHIPYGFILVKNKEGKAEKMSSRKGTQYRVNDLIDDAKEIVKKFIKKEELNESEIDEIAEKVAIGAIKYSLLRSSRNTDMIFDLNTSISFEGDSGPYVMYSYARSKSILRQGGESKGEINESTLNDKFEQGLIRELNKFPEITKAAAINYSPNLIAEYVFNVATKFNQFYKELSVLNAETEELKSSRLKLVEATSIVLKNGLNLLGIETVEKM